MSKIGLSLTCGSVEVTPYGNNNTKVDIEVNVYEVLAQIDVKYVINNFGSAELLSSIGQIECEAYFGSMEAP